MPPLVDAVLSTRLSAEVLSDQLMHWLRLQASGKLWLAAASPSSHSHSQPQVIDDVAQCAVAKLQLSVQLQSKLLSALFGDLSQGAFLCDPQGTLLAANEAFLQLMGYRCEELIGQSSDLLLPLFAQGELAADFRCLIHERSRWEGELSACRKGGELFPLWLQVRYLAVDSQEASSGYFLGLTTDLRASRQLEESVLQLSRTDSLAELNRILLEDRLALDIRQAELTHSKVALIRVSLSRFRALNEYYGRAIGDWVLMSQMQRLQRLGRCE